MKNIKIKFVAAMKEEADELRNHYPDIEVIETGVGKANVIKTFSRKFTKNTIYINVGYAGTNLPVEIGTSLMINRVSPEQLPEIKDNTITEVYSEDTQLGVKCFTSDNFVNSSYNQGVFDMELFYIALFPVYGLYSIKIITDKLDLEQFENFKKEDAWKKCFNKIDSLIEALKITNKYNIINCKEKNE